jgi:hypothetical protein
MAYEVVLLYAARQVVRELPPQERQRVAATLAEELTGEPGNATIELRRTELMEHRNFATFLTAGYVAVYRSMSRLDLKELRNQKGWKPSAGFFVSDLIPMWAISDLAALKGLAIS